MASATGRSPPFPRAPAPGPAGEERKASERFLLTQDGARGMF